MRFKKWHPEQSPIANYLRPVKSRDNHTAISEREYTAEEVVFMMEMDRRKRADRILYPTAADVLRWAKDFGYRKM